jgi:eukaryotic-like serine/threonine-protein kinase
VTDRLRVRRRLEYAVLAASGFLLAYVLVAFVVLPAEGVAYDVKVPSVVGLAFPDAERRLVSLGLTAALGESRFSADAPKSTVLSQNPASGTGLALGGEVVLEVSAGQQRATIPALGGLTRDDAERALKEAGLVTGQVDEQANDAPRGQVLAAKPEAGQVVPMGTRVDLVISAGPSELTMPDIVGQNLEAARALLEQLGLELNPPEDDSLSLATPGTVIAQTPAAGSAVAPGTTVSIRVAVKP